MGIFAILKQTDSGSDFLTFASSTTTPYGPQTANSNSSDQYNDTTENVIGTTQFTNNDSGSSSTITDGQSPREAIFDA